MKTDALRALRGPNLWSDDTLLEVVLLVDAELPTPTMLGHLRGCMTKELADMTQEIWDQSEACESHHGEACLVAELTVALQRAAGERAISLADRNLQCLDVSGDPFAEYFHV